MPILSPSLLFASSVLIATAHAASPDHWLPIGLLARAERFSRVETARMSAAAALGHVAISLALGLLLSVVPPLQHSVKTHADLVLGGIFLATGLFLAIAARLRHVAPKSPTSNLHVDSAGKDILPHEARRTARVARVAVPMGVAASPNIAILPVLLLAQAFDPWVAVGALGMFACATIGAFIVFTLLAQTAADHLPLDFLEHHADDTAAALLVLLGIAAWVGL